MNFLDYLAYASVKIYSFIKMNDVFQCHLHQNDTFSIKISSGNSRKSMPDGIKFVSIINEIKSYKDAQLKMSTPRLRA